MGFRDGRYLESASRDHIYKLLTLDGALDALAVAHGARHLLLLLIVHLGIHGPAGAFPAGQRRGSGRGPGHLPPAAPRRLGPGGFSRVVQTVLLCLISCPISASNHRLQEALPPVSSAALDTPLPQGTGAQGLSPLGPTLRSYCSWGGVSYCPVAPRHLASPGQQGPGLTGLVGHAFPGDPGR